MQNENENLVTFPSAKNFPIEEEVIDTGSYNDPIDDLLKEIEEMELAFTNNSNKIQEEDLIDDFDFNIEEEVLSKKVFPRKSKLKSSIQVLENSPTQLNSQSSIDQVIEVMRTRINELEECHKKTRFYINEIKLNQK